MLEDVILFIAYLSIYGHAFVSQHVLISFSAQRVGSAEGAVPGEALDSDTAFECKILIIQ